MEKKERNDRIFAVPDRSPFEGDLQDVRHLPSRAIQELEKFFEATDALEDKKLQFLGWRATANNAVDGQGANFESSEDVNFRRPRSRWGVLGLLGLPLRKAESGRVLPTIADIVDRYPERTVFTRFMTPNSLITTRWSCLAARSIRTCSGSSGRRCRPETTGIQEPILLGSRSIANSRSSGDVKPAM
jgi:hypothetical protein